MEVCIFDAKHLADGGCNCSLPYQNSASIINAFRDVKGGLNIAANNVNFLSDITVKTVHIVSGL